MLLIAGVFQSLAMVSLTVILVREAGQRFRGRVMGVRMMAIYSLPVGLLVAGALIERIGFAATATLYAAFGLVCHDHHRTALARAHVAGGGADTGGISGQQSLLVRHARACRGHPRLETVERKTWTAGTSPAVTDLTTSRRRSPAEICPPPRDPCRSR